MRIKHDGRLVNRNSSLPAYSYKIALKGKKSVAEWKVKRFFKCYPGYEVDVLYASGNVAGGNTRLATVRDTYLED